MTRSHMWEFTLGSLSESRSAPCGRQLVSRAANLTYESACRLVAIGRTFTLLFLVFACFLSGQFANKLDLLQCSITCTIRYLYRLAMAAWWVGVGPLTCRLRIVNAYCCVVWGMHVCDVLSVSFLLLSSAIGKVPGGLVSHWPFVTHCGVSMS